MKVFKLIGGIFRIGSGLVVLLFSLIGFNKYFFDNQERFEKYQLLYQEGITVMAQTDNEVKETKFKIKGAEIELYEVNYTFNVDEKDYTGKAIIAHPDSLKSEIEINYLPNEPEVSAADISTKLKTAQADLDSKSDLWLSLGALVVAIVILIFGVRKFKNALRGN